MEKAIENEFLCISRGSLQERIHSDRKTTLWLQLDI